MSESARILLVEDDPNLGFVIEESLEDEGFLVTRCYDGVEAKEAFFTEQFNMCLLDVMLPKKDGFELAREIRAVNGDVPVIFLTAKSLKEDRIEGFKIGGDDYITKPFSMEELILRIRAVLKRSQRSGGSEGGNEVLAIGSYRFDCQRQVLSLNNVEQKLTHREAELLKLLCRHQNGLLERDLALKLIWGETSFFAGRSMDVFVSKLRKYLKKDSRIRIVNVHGKGFKLLVDGE